MRRWNSFSWLSERTRDYTAHCASGSARTLRFRGSRIRAPTVYKKVPRRPTTTNNDKNIIQPFEWTRIVFLKRQLYFCKLTPRVSGGFSWGSARFGILNGGGGALIFCLILFAVTVMLGVVSIKAAGIAFTSVDVNWQNMRMAKQMEASSEALCAVTCAAGRQKGSHSLHVALWKKKHTRAEIGVRNALFHTASTVTLREKKNFFEFVFCRRLRGVAETRGVKVRSNFVAAPQLCARTCWDLQGAVSLCFVSMLLRHNCAQRPGKFHRLSELRGSSDTHDTRPRRCLGGMSSY